MNEIYRKISELCRSNNISISKLCTEIGVSRSLLSELKAGRTYCLSAKNIGLISEYFEVPTAFLHGEGVFENWREIIDNLDPVFADLRLCLPADLYWHEEDDKVLFAYLHSQVLYGENIVLFVNWLHECVQRIKITKNNVLPDDYLTPEYSAKITFRQSFDEQIRKHITQAQDGRPPMKAFNFVDALRKSLGVEAPSSYCPDEDELNSDSPDEGSGMERLKQLLHQLTMQDGSHVPEEESELIDIYRRLQKSGRRQLLGKAYELLAAQDTPPSAASAAPPDISVATAVIDSRIKK